MHHRAPQENLSSCGKQTLEHTYLRQRDKQQKHMNLSILLHIFWIYTSLAEMLCCHFVCTLSSYTELSLSTGLSMPKKGNVHWHYIKKQLNTQERELCVWGCGVLGNIICTVCFALPSSIAL